jgi:DNA-binding CsgD family transcriptional regulator
MTRLPCHKKGSSCNSDGHPTYRQVQALLEYAYHGDRGEAAVCLGISEASMRSRLARAREKVGAITSVHALYLLGLLPPPPGHNERAV